MKNVNRMTSIIVPVYNVEPYLPACLDSVLSQTAEEWECILIDDGSSDGSGEICDRYAARDRRFTVIRQANAGVSAARNAGLAAAKGAYITFLDSDDRIAPDYLQKMTAVMEDEVDFAFCGYRRITPAGDALYDSGYGEKLDVVLEKGSSALLGTTLAVEDEIMAALWASGVLSNVFSKLFRRKILCENEFAFSKDLSYAEDSLFAARYSTFCKKIAFVNDLLYDYLSREGSLSAAWWKGMLLQRSRSLTCVASVFAQNGFPMAQKEAEAMRDHINPEFLLEQISDRSLRCQLIAEYCALPNYRQMMQVVKKTRSLPTRLIYGLRSPRLLECYLTVVLKRRNG